MGDVLQQCVVVMIIRMQSIHVLFLFTLPILIDLHQVRVSNLF